MATGKRASMREGPLADLFRKTAAETSETSQDSPAGPVRAGGDEAAASSAPPDAAAHESAAPEPPAPEPPAPQPAAPDPVAETASRRRAFHPSFEGQVPPVADEPSAPRPVGPGAPAAGVLR